MPQELFRCCADVASIFGQKLDSKVFAFNLGHTPRRHLGKDWLKIPPQYWNEMTDDRKARDFFKTVEVPNDGAERGVKPRLINLNNQQTTICTGCFLRQFVLNTQIKLLAVQQ